MQRVRSERHHRVCTTRRRLSLGSTRIRGSREGTPLRRVVLHECKLSGHAPESSYSKSLMWRAALLKYRISASSLEAGPRDTTKAFAPPHCSPPDCVRERKRLRSRARQM